MRLRSNPCYISTLYLLPCHRLTSHKFVILLLVLTKSNAHHVITVLSFVIAKQINIQFLYINKYRKKGIYTGYLIHGMPPVSSQNGGNSVLHMLHMVIDVRQGDLIQALQIAALSSAKLIRGCDHDLMRPFSVFKSDLIRLRSGEEAGCGNDSMLLQRSHSQVLFTQ